MSAMDEDLPPLLMKDMAKDVIARAQLGLTYLRGHNGPEFAIEIAERTLQKHRAKFRKDFGSLPEELEEDS